MATAYYSPTSSIFHARVAVLDGSYHNFNNHRNWNFGELEDHEEEFAAAEARRHELRRVLGSGDRVEILLRYCAGESLRKIAADYDVGYNTIDRRAQEDMTTVRFHDLAMLIHRHRDGCRGCATHLRTGKFIGDDINGYGVRLGKPTRQFERHPNYQQINSFLHEHKKQLHQHKKLLTPNEDTATFSQLLLISMDVDTATWQINLMELIWELDVAVAQARAKNQKEVYHFKTGEDMSVP